MFVCSILSPISPVAAESAVMTKQDAVKKVATEIDSSKSGSKSESEKEAEKPSEIPNVDVIESQTLKSLSDSTQTSLEEKREDVNDTVIKSQKALKEKEAVQNKVDKLEQNLQETKAKIEDSSHNKSRAEISQLKKKSAQLKKEKQKLDNELKIKAEKVQKIYAQSAKQQDEIDLLKEQLHHLDMEKNKRFSPRKKARIILLIIIITVILLFIKEKLVIWIDNKLMARGNKGNTIRSLRTRTYLRIFSWVISVFSVATAIFFILELFGFDSTTTLTSAGFLGIAIGFGAQKFIKDIFSGLFLVSSFDSDFFLDFLSKNAFLAKQR